MSSLVTSTTAAKKCGKTHRTFLRLVEAGRITPTVRLGEKGAMLFDPADVETLREQLKAEVLAPFADTESAGDAA